MVEGFLIDWISLFLKLEESKDILEDRLLQPPDDQGDQRLHVLFHVKSPRILINLKSCVFAGDHLTMGVNCQHLAAQIEEDILRPKQAADLNL